MAKAKKSSKKSTRAIPLPDYKPSVEIDAGKFKGQPLKVGKSVNVTLKGRVVEERIDQFGGGKRKYRMEIDKVSPVKSKKK